MDQLAVYNACRVAFNCGNDGVPWHFVLHALREGLGMKEYQTHILTDKQKEAYPELQELLLWTSETRG